MTAIRYVYFVQIAPDGAIKIGSSTDVAARVAALRTASAQRLRFLGCMPGGFDKERALHDMFAVHRQQGEWFAPVPEILHLIAGKCLDLPEAPRRDLMMLPWYAICRKIVENDDRVHSLLNERRQLYRLLSLLKAAPGTGTPAEAIRVMSEADLQIDRPDALLVGDHYVPVDLLSTKDYAWLAANSGDGKRQAYRELCYAVHGLWPAEDPS